MSRIGKQPIEIPQKTEVKVEDGRVAVKGPLGEQEREFGPEIEIKVEENRVILSPKDESNQSRALWGTYASHIRNMIEGVNNKFVKKLLIEGVGYRAVMEGGKLVMSLGFSHKVELNVPHGLEVSVEKNEITVSGINKEEVGRFTAEIRAKKKPEPYKGKGIRYEGEVIRRKQGKKAI